MYISDKGGVTITTDHSMEEGRIRISVDGVTEVRVRTMLDLCGFCKTLKEPQQNQPSMCVNTKADIWEACVLKSLSLYCTGKCIIWSGLETLLDSRKCRHSVLPQVYVVSLFVENKGSGPVHFTYYSALHWMNCFILEDEHKVTRANPLQLLPGKSTHTHKQIYTQHNHKPLCVLYTHSHAHGWRDG